MHTFNIENNLRNPSDFENNLTTQVESQTPKRIEAKVVENNSQNSLSKGPVVQKQIMQKSSLFLSSGMNFFKIVSTDSKTKAEATYFSEGSPTIDLIWKIDLDSDVNSKFQTHLRSTSYKILPDTSKLYSIDTSSHQVGMIGFGYQINLSEQIFLLIDINHSFELFARSPSPYKVNFDQIETDTIHFGTGLSILKQKNLDFLLNFKGGYILKNDHSQTLQGSEVLLDVILTHKFSNDFSINGLVNYRIKNQDSVLSKQNINEFGLSLGVTKEFGQ